ncbi:Uncharacterised protein [Enterobacter asburiae]|nr:Uncharacterised protein [Enterobacter cloacae]SAF94667.1 Uncharacterised protein [Enterobacter asburiae]
MPAHRIIFLLSRSKSGPAVSAVNTPQKPNVKTRPGSVLSIIKSSPDSSVMPTIAW